MGVGFAVVASAGEGFGVVHVYLDDLAAAGGAGFSEFVFVVVGCF